MLDQLPKEFLFSYDYSMYLQDYLASLVVEGEARGAYNVKIVFRSQEEVNRFVDLKDGPAIICWLESNGYELEVGEIYYRQNVVALLSDFCQFIYESLVCSRKGKQSVAYALLRKPFKDNLFYLEWLLADRDDFLKAFVSGGPDLMSVSKISPSRRKRIIHEAAKKAHSFDRASDFLYDLRYQPDAKFGLQYLWDRAIHLVTNNPAYRTEPINFNFIFSDHQAHLDQWEQYYCVVPMILLHAAQIADTLVTPWLGVDQLTRSIEHLRRVVGFRLWVKRTYQPGSKLEDLIELLDYTPLSCPHCNRTVHWNEEKFRLFYEDMVVKCENCLQLITPGISSNGDRITFLQRS